MAMASSKWRARGLSIKTGLPHWAASRNWARCGRPSTLSSSRPSTRGQRSEIFSTSLTLQLVFQLVGVFVDTAGALLNVGTAAFKGGDNARAGTRSGLVASFNVLVKAEACDVSVPMMPRRRSCASAGSIGRG